jgi:hypothetical protein
MTEDLLRFLRQNPGLFYCASCLVRGSSVPLRALGDAWAGLVTQRTVQVTETLCVVCGQVRTVVRVQAATSGTDAA